jgi:hypothetical protein
LNLQESLLVAILKRQEARRRTRRPDNSAAGPARAAAGAQILAWVEEGDHGPRISDLRPPGADDAERKRVSRALASLAKRGLAELWGPWGDNMTRVRLTPKGLEAAQALANGSPVAEAVEQDPMAR